VAGTPGFGLVPLPGGHSGETFLADAAGERTVVRVYGRRGATRGVDAPVVDAAVLRLVRGLLPVAEVLDVQRPRPHDDAPGLLVTSFLPGDRLDLLLPGLDETETRTVGHRLGVLLARLATMPMPRAGRFVDGELRIEPFGPPHAGDLVAAIEAVRPGSALVAWPREDLRDLLRLADRAQRILDPVTRTTLVHSDLNPKNLLVDPVTLEVTGLVDWEFAHAGLPVTDLGNLLRFERDPVLTGAVVEAYRRHVPDAAPDVLHQARAADLWALVDLAGRRGENPVADRAHDLLLAMARDGDLHAVPRG
jgi:Ser/Thr protein kinase RdoA (MazF antagonist)